jgi:hypothetical protein
MQVLPDKLIAHQLVQKFPTFHKSIKIYYRVHSSPYRVFILSQIYPVHALRYYLLKIRFNIILPATHKRPKLYLSFR